MKALPAVCLFFLTGCLSMSDSEKKEHLASASSLQKSAQEGLASGFFAQGDWPDSDWWNSFEAPLLGQWIQEAFAKNPTLHSLASSIELARQEALVARAKLMPTLYFNALDNYRYFSEHELQHLLNPALSLSGFEVDLSLAFNYEFDFWNKNRNMFHAAVGEWKAQTAELADVQLILSTSLAQAYFALFTTQKKEELYKELKNVRERKFLLEERLRVSALLSALPPLLADEKVQEAEQQVVAMQDEIRIQIHLINVLMGRGPDEPLELDVMLKAPPKTLPLPQDLSTNLLARRPDLMVQIWRAEALAAQTEVARADFFPNINLAAFGALKSVAWNTLFEGSSHSLGYTPAIHLPIFTAGAIKANIRAKKAGFDQAIYQYNNLLLTSAQEVADKLSQVQTIYKQKQLQDRVVEDSLKRLELTELRFEGRLDSQFGILDYQEALILQKIKNVDLLYQQYAFAVKFIKSLGGGYLSSHVPISRESS